MKELIAIFAIFLLIFSCKESSELSAEQAENMVEDYMETNPIFETTNFDTSKMRLSSKKDAELLNALLNLESEGLVEIVDEKSRKKWFSKDSVFVITPTLTTDATPFVVKQSKNKTEVKTVNYILDKKQDVIFERKSKNVATFNAILLKEKTPFYAFGDDQNPNADFITKKFKAKYSEEFGWELVE